MDHVTKAHEQALIEAAARSTCQRDQRGALLVWSHSGVIVSEGWNGLPQAHPCMDAYCQPTCAKSAEHAEAMAIRRFPHSQHPAPMDVDIIHAKVADGAIAVSRSPHEKACKLCAVQMLAHGVSGIWLFTHHGWERWSASNYYDFACDGQ